MIRAALLSNSISIPERHAFIITNAERIDQVYDQFNASELLNFEEVGFCGPHSSSLHDQFDEYIGEGIHGDPLTQVFLDWETLTEYLSEHTDVGIDCVLLCDGVESLSKAKSLAKAINS